MKQTYQKYFNKLMKITIIHLIQFQQMEILQQGYINFIFTKQLKINFNLKKNYQLLNNSISDLMTDLSLKIVKDGEGLSKLIKLNILNSKSKLQAKKIGFSILNSSLVKTAISGEDANWGRIIAAIEKSKEKINQNKIKIFFGKNLVCQNGFVNRKINLSKLNRYMKNKLIEINLILNTGNVNQTLYGNDLTYEYIRINVNLC